MTTTEALKKFHAATVADVASIGADILTFGTIVTGEIVDALNATIDIIDEGTYFTVRSDSMEMMVTFEESGIYIHSARRTI